MRLNVLDKGYVHLVDVLGSDLSVVNAARVSYDKESSEMSDADERLLSFLWTNGHTSPFRHAALTFEVYAPLFVARQWWKHVVASCHLDDQNGWNESSRRYVTEDPEFYIPEWRSAPENKKQGSGEPIDDDRLSRALRYNMEMTAQTGVASYEFAMHNNIAPEQARLFLPAYAMYVRWRWTVSLHGVLHFVSLRKEHTAQYEITEYAEAIGDMVDAVFPVTSRVVNNGE